MSITVADIPHWRRLFDPTGQPAGYVWTTDGAGGGSYQPAGGGGGNTIIVEDEGTPLATAADTLNFTGAGVTASGTGTTKTINVPGAANTITIEDEGTPLTTDADTLDFVGAGVTASGTGTTKTITIPGGISGITVEDEGTPLTTDADTLNFTGAGVTASGTGTTKTINIPGSSGGAFTLDSAENLYAGTGALASVTTGIQNFAGGLNALNLLQSGNYCVAIGTEAGENITTTATGNICIGLQAVSGLASSSLRGSYNVGVGYEALALLSGFNTNYNIGIGGFAGSRVSTGDFNTFVGGRSGPITSALTGNLNTGLGYQAGRRLQGLSQRNTFLGNDTGFNIITGSENICIGDSAGPTTLNQSQKLYIDINTTDTPIIFGDLNALVRTIAINGQFESTGNSGATSFRVDNNATAAETRMLLWDVDNGTLARVSVGAANSGGAGFKVLRIPN